MVPERNGRSHLRLYAAPAPSTIAYLYEAGEVKTCIGNSVDAIPYKGTLYEAGTPVSQTGPPILLVLIIMEAARPKHSKVAQQPLFTIMLRVPMGPMENTKRIRYKGVLMGLTLFTHAARHSMQFLITELYTNPEVL